MHFDKIIENVSKHISLGARERDYFKGLLQVKSVKRGELLLSKGQSCQYIDFVNSGIFRAYHLSDKGKESTLMFAMPGWWITDMACFVQKAPALINIQAVEQGEVLRLSETNLSQLLQEVPKFEKCFRILFQHAYVREQLRSIQTLTQTAEERYSNFIEKYPELAQKITQKQIASYLGITPEFLSAIRAARK